MPYTGTIDGPRLMRQYLGLPSVADIQQGDNPALELTKSNVVAGSGATVTLTPQQSASTIMFDRAAGIVYTLPAPEIGLRYRFLVSVAATSNTYKIITSAGTIFATGALTINTVNATPGANDGPKTFQGNGSTHIAVSMNGTTTGGLIGTWIDCVCVSATAWQVCGHVVASGVVATPFATS